MLHECRSDSKVVELWIFESRYFFKTLLTSVGMRFMYSEFNKCKESPLLMWMHILAPLAMEHVALLHMSGSFLSLMASENMMFSLV